MTGYAFLGAVEQGLVYGIMVLGVYLTFQVLDFPDLTVDGNLPLGAAIASVAITNGINPYAALFLAAVAGFLAGMVTALLNTKLKVLHLLASILTMIALYSINIRIMSGPNVSLLGQPTVFDPLKKLGLPGYWAAPLIFLIIAVIVTILIVWFLHTELGQALMATGDNPKMITSCGVNTHNMILMGVGTIIAGLASVIVGETLFGNRSILQACFAALLGSIVYRIAIALALGLKWGNFAFTPSDLNLITALLVVVALSIPHIKSRFQKRSAGSAS